jgi:hypothetical protein
VERGWQCGLYGVDRYAEWDRSYSTDLIPARRQPSFRGDLTAAAAFVETAPDLTVHSSSPTSEVRRRRSGAIVGFTLVGLVLVAIAAVATYVQHASVDPSLTSARAELHQTLDRFRAARDQLGATTGLTDTVEHSLASDTTLLSQDQAQLANTEARNDLAGVNVSDLHICLAGVERALNQFALSDRSGAMATLGGVAGSCRDAEAAGT